MSKLSGVSREAEEKKLKEIIGIAEAKMASVKGDVRALEASLHAMQQDFDEADKEQQAQWHNTDARFRYAKRELQMAAQARKKPYFGRIDLKDHQLGQEECYYIGRSVIAEDPAQPDVIDWRAPIASVYYDSSLGETSYSVKGEGKFEITLNRKRTYEIEADQLKDFYDSDVVANDELLTKYLAKNKRSVLSEIIATIQQEQNEVIRKKPQHNLIVQGAAGSGKTTVAMHRISYILYNYDTEFKPEDFYVIGSNQVLLNYITGVLPELNVYGVSQMTMEQLFVRLLYEDWSRRRCKIKPVVRGVTEPVKGTKTWFEDLAAFCHDYERSLIPRGDVRLEKNHARLLGGDTIDRLLDQFERYSRADKIRLLTERLEAKLENEICGKYYSYTEEEKKQYRKQYKTYFGKPEWKGSIYELYDDFLKSQAEKGIYVKRPEGQYDVYDLAALAYIYKRIKETEVIREAGHVVIDEAQDFGMMAYCSLKYCLSTCTYTIMGDVSQNVFMDYGLNDWQELREVMLPGEFDYFGLLRKSYRNTVEISEFATNILKHGEFQIYPVQPIIRHGEAVKTESCESREAMLEKTEQILKEWQKKGLETIAVICADQEQADQVSEILGQRMELLPNSGEKMEFGNGVLVLPLEYTKGLEFDAVLIYDASAENYPVNDGNVKRLYVAATRALHELAVLHCGALTDLVAVPVPEEKNINIVMEGTKITRPALPPVEEKTHAQIAAERAQRGEREMEERRAIGPKRIVIRTNKDGGSSSGITTGSAAENAWSGLLSQGMKETSQGRQDISLKERAEAGRPSEVTAEKAEVPHKENKAEGVIRKGPVKVVVPVKTGAGRTSGTGLSSGSGNGPKNPYKMPSYYDQMMSKSTQAKEAAQKEIQQKKKEREFGSRPEQTELAVPGHARMDSAVKMSMNGKYFADIYTGYGTLHLEAVTNQTMRVCFTKNGDPDFGPAEGKYAGRQVSVRYKDGREFVEVSTEKLMVRIAKKTGELSFLDSKGKELLRERGKDPRQVESKGGWSFFEWDRKEGLRAAAPDGSPKTEIGLSAVCISYGKESGEMPELLSSKGYTMSFPSGRRTVCCRIPMYGQYVFQEGEGIEYYLTVSSLL